MYYTGNFADMVKYLVFFSPCYLMSFYLHEVYSAQTKDQQHPTRRANKEHCQVNITKVNVKGYISVSQCCSIPHHILLEPLTVVHTSEH